MLSYRNRVVRLPVPQLLLEEQHRIVKTMEQLRSRLQLVKQAQAETAAELGALLPSILDRAFKGELV